MNKSNFADYLKELMRRADLDFGSLREKVGLERSRLQSLLSGEEEPTDEERQRFTVLDPLYELSPMVNRSLPSIMIALKAAGEVHRLPEFLADVRHAENRGDLDSQATLGTREVNAWLKAKGLTDFDWEDDFASLS